MCVQLERQLLICQVALTANMQKIGVHKSRTQTCTKSEDRQAHKQKIDMHKCTRQRAQMQKIDMQKCRRQTFTNTLDTSTWGQRDTQTGCKEDRLP